MNGWPAGYGLIELSDVDSTNEEAKRLGRKGESGPVWIRADRQSAGRGRRGHVWESLEGNLFATLLIRPTKPLGRCAQLAYAIALATSDVCAHFAPAAEIRLKWPNDVMASGRKIAGLLVEAEADGGAVHWIAAGVGINLSAHPSRLSTAATSLAEIGGTVPSAKAALIRLADRFATWYAVWDMQGFAPLRMAWLSRAEGLGRRVVVRLEDRELSGHFEEIDDTGAMLMRLPGGALHRIAAGEVHLC